jgi:hypothetical protein
LAAASKRGQAPDFLDAESAAPSGDEFVAASMAAAPKRQREAKPLAPMSDEDRKLWDDFSSVKEYNPDFSRRLREAAALKQQTQHVRDGGLMDLGGDSEDDEVRRFWLRVSDFTCPDDRIVGSCGDRGARIPLCDHGVHEGRAGAGVAGRHPSSRPLRRNFENESRGP